jgi:hypothetical protein
MKNKDLLTRTLYEKIPEPGYNLEQAQLLWWCNVRATGGLRLTQEGWKVLKRDLELESYSINLDKKEINKQFILDLDRKLTTPYFIERDRIHLFGSREAVMALLHGNMSRYLESLARS